MLSHRSINKATVSLRVGIDAAGDTASVSELSDNPLFTALNACTVESLIDSMNSDPMLKDVFECYENVVDGKPDTTYTLLSDLVDGEHFVSDRSQIIPFNEFIKGVVVINLAEVGQDDATMNMLVAIFLNLFFDHMLKIEKRDYW